jgi:hypothetical protein
MTDTVSLGQTTDVLDEISVFRGQRIDFTLESINKNRKEHGLHEISHSKALNAILSAIQDHFPDMTDEDTVQILAGFFGPDADTMDIVEYDSAAYVQSIAALNATSTINGPRGPSLGCVYHDIPLGVYLYAMVLAKRLQDK